MSEENRASAEEKILRLLGLARRAGKVTGGLDATLAAMEKAELKLVLLAGDIGPSSRKKLCRRALELNCPVYLLEADAAGIGLVTGALKRAVAGVTDGHFAAGIVKAAEAGAIRPL